MDYFKIFKDFCGETSKKITDKQEFLNEKLKTITTEKENLLKDFALDLYDLKIMIYDVKKLKNGYDKLYFLKHLFAIGCIIGIFIFNSFNLFNIIYILPFNLFCLGAYFLTTNKTRRVLKKYNIKNEFSCDYEYKKLDDEICNLIDKNKKREKEINNLIIEEKEIKKRISELNNEKTKNEIRTTKIEKIDYYLNEESVKKRKRTVK